MRDGIFEEFFAFNCRPEVVSDVISGVAEGRSVWIRESIHGRVFPLPEILGAPGGAQQLAAAH